MYFDALSFLEDEREAWAPFEALLALPDEALDQAADPDGPTHGWSGRDLMVHLSAWQEAALDAARELAVGETSRSIERASADWNEQGEQAINAEIAAAGRALALDEVRRRFASIPGELRGYLTVVPETRWVKHPAHLEYFLQNTMDHYAEHEGELKAILALAGPERPE